MNILIVAISPLDRDPRILRQIKAYKDDYNIETLGLCPASETIKNFKPLFVSCITKKFITFHNIIAVMKLFLGNCEDFLYYRYGIRKLSGYDFSTPDLIVANDWDGFFIATELKKEKNWNSKIYFDAHEYAPKELNTLSWIIFRKPLIVSTLKRNRNAFSIISTVCPSIAKLYESFFRLESGTVRIITNAPNYEPNLKPQPTGDKIRMIHHGGAMKLRKLEKMIDMMAYLPQDSYELNFMLIKSDKEYYDTLVQQAKKYPNIHFIDPVPTTQIASFTNQFDIGLFILDNDIINYRYALPNKFFEFAQARLAIAVGDSPEMRSYIEKYQLGVSAKKNTPKAMADEILKLSKDDIMRFKNNAHKYARELSAEPNIEHLKRIAEELTET